jgi:glutamate racemase
VVLGCTHYPFVIPLIQEIAGPGVRVIDPAPAVARQARRLLAGNGAPVSPGLDGCKPAPVRYLTTGNAARMQALLRQLNGENEGVESVRWADGVILPILARRKIRG